MKINYILGLALVLFAITSFGQDTIDTKSKSDYNFIYEGKSSDSCFASIANKKGGYVTNTELFSCDKLDIDLPGYNIVSFDIVRWAKDKAAKAVSTSGNEISDEMKEHLKTAKEGDGIFFEKIKCKGPNNKIIEMCDLNFIIVNENDINADTVKFNKSGSTQYLKTSSFDVTKAKQAPRNLSARIAGKSQGSITVAALSAEKILVYQRIGNQTRINDQYNVVAFAMIIHWATARADVLSVADNNALSEEMKQFITGCEDGETVRIYNILCVGPEKELFQLPVITFTIRS